MPGMMLGANTNLPWAQQGVCHPADDRYTLKLNNYLIAVVTYTMKEKYSEQ